MKTITLNNIVFKIGDKLNWEHFDNAIINNFTIIDIDGYKVLLRYNYHKFYKKNFSAWFDHATSFTTLYKVCNRKEKLERLLR